MISGFRNMALCLVLVFVPASAAVVGHLVQYDGLKRADVAKMPEPQRAAWLAYLERSAVAHQADVAALGAERQGLTTLPPSPEESFHDSSIPLKNPDSWYAGPEAHHIADVIVSFQTPAGGWGKNQDFAKAVRVKGQMWTVTEEAAVTHPEDFGNPKAANWHYVGTIDNDATFTQMRFLAKVIAAGQGVDTTAWRASFLSGLDYLFAAEMPCGGWPQIWPLEGGYHDALTYNDNAIANVMELLEDVITNQKGMYGFVPADVKAKAVAVLARARAVVLQSQIVIDGKPSGWGQQYDALTMRPVAARKFEPTALSAGESADILMMLMKLRDPSPAEVAAIHAGVAWLKAVAVPDVAWEKVPGGRNLVSKPGAPAMWSRYYDLTTMKPIFGDRDESIHDDVNEISAERRAGYSWYNTGPAKALKAYDQWVGKHPAP